MHHDLMLVLFFLSLFIFFLDVIFYLLLLFCSRLGFEGLRVLLQNLQ